MKCTKHFVIAVIFLGTLLTANAQSTVVRTYPRSGTVVTTLKKPIVIAHQRANYYFANGVWHRAQGRKYVVCAAPAGTAVKRLPRGRRVVYVKGRKLYKYSGVWYRRVGGRYVVVNI